ncbi:hypothetical protein Pelo_445 [Pelomyxa schiedti]|nr:hypothetical protein Pelo_445 [Pelomyxa schiedti]
MRTSKRGSRTPHTPSVTTTNKREIQRCVRVPNLRSQISRYLFLSVGTRRPWLRTFLVKNMHAGFAVHIVALLE